MFDDSPGARGPGGFRFPDQWDWKLVLPLGLVGLSGGLAVIADQAVFAHPPRNVGERLLAIPLTLLYRLVEDRLTAVVGTGLLFLFVGLAAAFLSAILIERHILTPLQIKRMVEATRREESLVNRFRRPDL